MRIDPLVTICCAAESPECWYFQLTGPTAWSPQKRTVGCPGDTSCGNFNAGSTKKVPQINIQTHFCLSNALDRPSNQFFSVCLCVCQQIGCRTITPTILYRFSRNFTCGSEMWSLRCLLFVTETGSSLLIVEMCGFRFRQFSGSGDHIFQQNTTKSHVQIKFSNANFVSNGEWNQK